jgi:lysophospholipase L1-like esterase
MGQDFASERYGQTETFRFPFDIEGQQEIRRVWGNALRRWYSALANRESAPANILFVGDSVTEGYYTSAESRRWTELFRDAIQRMYRIGGAGFIPARHTVPASPPTSPWVAVGGDTTDYGFGIGRRALTLSNVAHSNTLTFSGDRVWVLYTQGAGVGGMSISIDGGAAVNIDTNAATMKSGRVWDSGALSLGTHTVQVKPVGFGAAPATINCVVDGAMVFSTDYSGGVHVWEGGHAGYWSNHFNGGTTTEQYWAQYADNQANAAFTNGVSILNSTTYTSATANFTTLDVGRFITGTNIPASTYIRAVVNSTTITLSQNASAAGSSLSFTITNRYTYSIKPDLVVIQVGLNDQGGGQNPATFKANVQAIVSTLVTQGALDYTPSVILMGIWARSDSGRQDTEWQPFRTAMEELANEKGYAFFDLYNLGGWIGTDQTMLLTTDGLHPNDRGSQWIADELCRLLAGLPRLATIPQGIFDAKGDLIVAAAGDQAAKLTVGADNQVLMADAAQSLGVKWAHQQAAVQIAGNTSGTTASVSSGTLTLAGGPNITLSQAGNAISVSAAAAGAAAGSYWQNCDAQNSAQGLTYAGISYDRITLLPLENRGQAFPYDMTVSTAMLNVSGNFTATTVSSSFTSSFGLALYTLVNSTQLNLLNSVYATIARAANVGNTTNFHGARFATIHSSQWSSQPVVRAGSHYWLAVLLRSANLGLTASISLAGQFLGNTTQRSGTVGLSVATNISMGGVPFQGLLTATNFPATIAATNVTPVSSQANFQPHLIFNNQVSSH